MKKKLNCILLIDDDEPTNYLNELVIREMECTEHIRIALSGKEGLAYLKSGGHPRPDLIILDINMPGMDGWEFLEAYKKLNGSQRGKVVIVMLTTSLNPDDEKKSGQFEEIDGFKHKPLTKDKLKCILERYFNGSA